MWQAENLAPLGEGENVCVREREGERERSRKPRL
jgi:hypothetical protein